MITKELLSEVLGLKVWKVLDENMGTLRYCIYPNKGDEPSEYMFPINIHELAHKCKEWAIKESYDILSGGLEAGLYSCYIDYSDKRYTLQMNPLHHEFANTEPEAVFAACEWILKTKENNARISP